MGENRMVNDHFMAEEELLTEEDFRLLSNLGVDPPRRDPVPAQNSQSSSGCSTGRVIVKRPESEIPVAYRKSELVRYHRASVARLTALNIAAGGTQSNFSVESGRPRKPGMWPSHTTYQPITIAELREDVVHRGRVLFGTLSAESFQVNCIGNVLEDQAGYAVCIGIYNCNLKFPCGLKLAIKEPYFKLGLNGKMVIRVDDAGSIERVKEFPGPSTPELEPLNKLKLQGNRFFGLKLWNRAIGLYTECIKGCEAFLDARPDEKMRKEVLLPALSNRAESYLKVDKFQQALVDCNKALRINPEHLKSLFRKGRALDGLQEFDRATFWLRKSLAGASGGSDIEPFIALSRACSEQGKTGVYNISEFLKQKASPPRCSDFVGPVKLGPSPAMTIGRQLALFAARDVKRGELLLVNNAIAMLHGSSDSEFQLSLATSPAESKRHELVDSVLSKLADSRRAASQFKFLTLSPEKATDLSVFRSSNGSFSEDSTLTVEQNLKDYSRKAVRKLLVKHGFETWMPYMVSNAGLWVLPSLVNHSCISNTSLLQVGSAMFVHAARDIKENEQLTVAYCDALLPLHKRQEQYQAWGFNCKCRRCILEESLKKQLLQLNESFSRNFGDQFQLASLGLEVEKQLLLLSSLKPEERYWLRASYMLTFVAGIQSIKYLSSCSKRCMTVEEILQLVQAVAPGHTRGLTLVSQQVAALMRYGSGEQVKLIEQEDIKEIFKSSLGDQESQVLLHVMCVCSPASC